MGFRSTIELILVLNCLVCVFFFLQGCFMVFGSR